VKVIEAVEPATDLTPPAGLIPLAVISNFTSGPVPADLKASSAFQIVHNSYQCDEGSGGSATDLTLCIFTPTEEERDDWLWSIRLGTIFKII